MATAWGPLQPLLALLMAQLDEAADAEDGGVGRAKALDAALAREMAGDEMAAALKAAALEQLDAALAHDLLDGGSRPASQLILLAAKASKIEVLQQRRLVPELQLQVAASAALLVSQVGRFLVRVPISVVNKELRRVSLLCATLANVAVEMDAAIKAVFPLRSLLSRFHHQPNSAVVTPIHGHFFYLCLRAKTYAAAADVLAMPLSEIHPQPQLVDSVDFLRYAYYGGVLLLGQKRFHDAIDFLLLAVTAPADALSVFVIEANKKLVLATLLADGEPAPLPKYTSFVVSRHLESHCVIYSDLARAFVVDRDVTAMRAVVEQHEATFSKDGNLGLARQCIVALQHRKLLQLTRTYATIGLAELAGAAGIAGNNISMTDGAPQEPVVSTADAEKMLLELISSGLMEAVIDRHEGKVTFVLEDESGDKAELDNAEMMQRLQQEMQKLVFVASRLRDMDAELVTSAKFQAKLAKDKDRRQRLAMHNQQSDEGIDAAPGVSMDTSE